MSYLLVMWGNLGEEALHKVENLTETGGEVRLPLGPGRHKVSVTSITPEAARAYRKAVANGDNPIKAVVDATPGAASAEPPQPEGENPNPGDPVGGGDGQV